MNDLIYDGDLRRALLAAIPLRDGADPDALIRMLTDAARDAVARHKRRRLPPSAKMVRKELDRLRRTYNKLEPETKEALSHALGHALGRGHRPTLRPWGWGWGWFVVWRATERR